MCLSALLLVNFAFFPLSFLFSPLFSQWSPVAWSLRASVDVYFAEPSLEGSFRSFSVSLSLSHLSSISFHFHCNPSFPFFFVNNGKDAYLHTSYFSIGICQLVNDRYDMGSSFQKFLPEINWGWKLKPSLIFIRRSTARSG